ncbi:MAG: hypothetical protein ACI9BD_001344 [Candidatus Marinamargulisbacteria bacterium]|jgi:hypothetical protein
MLLKVLAVGLSYPGARLGSSLVADEVPTLESLVETTSELLREFGALGVSIKACGEGRIPQRYLAPGLALEKKLIKGLLCHNKNASPKISLFILLSPFYQKASAKKQKPLVGFMEAFIDRYSWAYSAKVFQLVPQTNKAPQGLSDLSAYQTLRSQMDDLAVHALPKKEEKTWTSVLRSIFGVGKEVLLASTEPRFSSLFDLFTQFLSVSTDDDATRKGLEERLGRETVYKSGFLGNLSENLPAFLESEYYTLIPLVVDAYLASSDRRHLHVLIKSEAVSPTQKDLVFGKIQGALADLQSLASEPSDGDVFQNRALLLVVKRLRDKPKALFTWLTRQALPIQTAGAEAFFGAEFKVEENIKAAFESIAEYDSRSFDITAIDAFLRVWGRQSETIKVVASAIATNDGYVDIFPILKKAFPVPGRPFAAVAFLQLAFDAGLFLDSANFEGRIEQVRDHIEAQLFTEREVSFRVFEPYISVFPEALNVWILSRYSPSVIDKVGDLLPSLIPQLISGVEFALAEPTMPLFEVSQVESCRDKWAMVCSLPGACRSVGHRAFDRHYADIDGLTYFAFMDIQESFIKARPIDGESEDQLLARLIERGPKHHMGPSEWKIRFEEAHVKQEFLATLEDSLAHRYADSLRWICFELGQEAVQTDGHAHSLSFLQSHYKAGAPLVLENPGRFGQQVKKARLQSQTDRSINKDVLDYLAGHLVWLTNVSEVSASI